jgi:uncharacterized protein (TIGR02246 family)
MRIGFRLVSEVAVVAVVAAGCARKETEGQRSDRSSMASTGAARVDTAAAAAEIRRGDEQFFNAVKSRDAQAAADLYADDAISMPANSPPLKGRDAILKFNQEFLKLPKLTMTGAPETIGFSDDGTVAYDAGKYSVSYTDANGRTVREEGKYLNVERRVDGKWKVVADAFSGNGAAPK